MRIGGIQFHADVGDAVFLELGGGLAEAGFFVEGAGVGLGFHYYLLRGEALAGQAYALGEYAGAERRRGARRL